ncbi:hypothetical protein, partial [Thiolapillus sp.]
TALTCRFSQHFASVANTRNVHYVMYVMLQTDPFESFHSIIIIIICHLTPMVVGEAQIIWRPVSSISPVLSGTWRTPGLSIP